MLNGQEKNYAAALEPAFQPDALEHVWTDALEHEIEAHEQYGFYVPTREELMDTTGDFFLHLLSAHA